MKKKSISILKRIAVLAIILYVIYIFVGQYKTLNSYAVEEAYYQQLIKEKNDEKDELMYLNQNINSPEYIEKLAREKLGMYLPNEKVYIDINE